MAEIIASDSTGGVPASAELVNPIIADLTRTYGKPIVEKLLGSLVRQLVRLEPTSGGTLEVERTAHAIKGAAASLGFDVVADTCLELEAACQAGGVILLQQEKAYAACARARVDIVAFLAVSAQTRPDDEGSDV